jgi:hypothetical protein
MAILQIGALQLKSNTVRMKADDSRLANAIGHGCVWKNCTNCFHGDMPEGWTWQINYHDRKPTILRWTPKQWATRPYLDVCLCPEHTKLLNTLFKPNSGVSGNEIVAVEVQPPHTGDILDEVLESMPTVGNA